MSTLRILFVSLSMGCCWVLPGHAGPVSLDVRPGLWEMTSTGQTSGAPPIPAEVLARLTPEQRAKFEATITARTSKPRVSKQCVTVKSLQRGFNLDENASGDSCKKTVVLSTATIMDVRVECSGQKGTSGKFHFEAVSPVAIKGTIDMTMTDGSHTMSINRVIEGKWLGADCGTLKNPED